MNGLRSKHQHFNNVSKKLMQHTLLKANRNRWFDDISLLETMRMNRIRVFFLVHCGRTSTSIIITMTKLFMQNLFYINDDSFALLIIIQVWNVDHI